MNVHTIGVKLNVHEAVLLIIIRCEFLGLNVYFGQTITLILRRMIFSTLYNRFALDMDGFVRLRLAGGNFLLFFNLRLPSNILSRMSRYCRHFIYLQRIILHGLM